MAETPVRSESLGREEQPQVRQVVVRQERGLALDVRLGPTATTHPSLHGGRVETQAVALHQHDPGQVLVIGLLEAVADRRQAVEPIGSCFRRFGVAQHDREGRTAVPAPQQARQIVEVFYPEPERAQKVTVACTQSSPRSALRLAPVRALRRAILQLVQRQQPFVVEARKSRFQRRQRLRQEAECRMSIRLCERLATETLDLTRVQLLMDWRRLAGRSAESGAAGVQHHEKHGGRAPALAGPPALEHGRSRRSVRRSCRGNFQAMRPLSEEQAGRPETVLRWRQPASHCEIGEELGVYRHLCAPRILQRAAPAARRLDHDAFDLVDGDPIRRPVVELRRFG